jgi:2-amino-4-hydroxy-6-hydroxymethyldihydropteridine diphosphokinase
MSENERVYLALGTNIGDREGNLQTAKAAMQPKVTILEESPIYVTPPWGYLDQPDFLNQVIAVTTRLAPVSLLRFLKQIEKTMGREKLIQNGPRLIDLDILFYGNRVVDEGNLQIPHPRMPGRAFVLVPLNDLASDFIHPQLELSILDMLIGVDTSGVKPL